jgi:hypothetical protein
MTSTTLRIHGALRARVSHLCTETGTTPAECIDAFTKAHEVTTWPGERQRLPRGCEPWTVRLPVELVERFSARGTPSLDLSWTLAGVLDLDIS